MGANLDFKKHYRTSEITLRHVRVCVTKRKFAMRKQMRFLLANDAVRAASRNHPKIARLSPLT